VGDVAAARKLDEAEVGRIFREESGRSVAALIRVFGDIDVAEDAVQDAFAVALREWTGDGLPPNPGASITTTARNRAIDRLAASRVDGNCSARWRCSPQTTTIPARPERRRTEFVHPTRFAGVLCHRESLSIFAFIVPPDLELTASEAGLLPHWLTVNW
jgi:DNA-directed RNA polymerase specialized sigma24 family protein